MRQEKKTKEISARVTVTPDPEHGVNKFEFFRPIGQINPNKVEALLQFNDAVDPKHLFACLNKMVSCAICEDPQNLNYDDAIAIEQTYNYILNYWRAETGEYEPVRTEIFL